MQLLHCNPIPTTQFASLSLLLKNDKRTSVLLVASPFATLSKSSASRCIHELQEYIYSIQEKSTTNTDKALSNTEISRIHDQLLNDDATLVLNDATHIFHPLQASGMALHYSILKEKSIVQKCASILLQGLPSKLTLDSVQGVLLAVGISGTQSSSALVATRIHDFKQVLQGLGTFADPTECQSCVKAIMATSLLMDDEELKTNAMVDLEQVTLSSDVGGGDSAPAAIEKLKSPIGAVRKSAKKTRRSMSSLKDVGGGTSDLKLVVTATSSAHSARSIAEKVAILSVSEKESQLRKYEASGVERRSSMATALSKTKSGVVVKRRRRKSGVEAGLEGFDCPSIPPSKQYTAPPTLKPPGLDTASQVYAQSTTNNAFNNQNRPPRLSPKKPALPTLLAPRNDVGSNRRSSGQHHHQTSRRWSGGGRPAPLTFAASDVSTPGSQAAFNAFAVESAVNDSFANGSFPNQQFVGVKDSKAETNGTSHNHYGGDTTGGRDPWGVIPAAATTEFNNSNAAPSSYGAEETSPGGHQQQQQRPRFEFAMSSPSDERESALSPSAAAHRSRNDAVESLQRMLLAAERSEMNGLKDDDETSRGSRSVASFQNGEWMGGMDQELLSAHSELDELVAKVTPAENGDDIPRQRLMINVALNEDLTCSYRQSKMSSCSIEGVVQVQVSCDSRDGVPFYLLVRDPSKHIRIVQENKRFADSMSEELRLSDNPDDVGIDHKYTVSVPSADDYFPVLRYKCSSELRPVPIRVQTRVRVNEASCRVALQISSNPANEDDLTDLTIVMGVPLEVKGETLVTTPAGGVWNAAKRSVIWCVAELGDGEKFQLQAEFEMNPSSPPLPPGTKPKFPVLVRCQCMYAQLSDLELEVSDIADVFPADVTMKMARRFRLSHRERS